jgi:hypothetical protein
MLMNYQVVGLNKFYGNKSEPSGKTIQNSVQTKLFIYPELLFLLGGAFLVEL